MKEKEQMFHYLCASDLRTVWLSVIEMFYGLLIVGAFRKSVSRVLVDKETRLHTEERERQPIGQKVRCDWPLCIETNEGVT